MAAAPARRINIRRLLGQTQTACLSLPAFKSSQADGSRVLGGQTGAVISNRLGKRKRAHLSCETTPIKVKCD